jgi:hypothetical protein
MSLGKRLFIGEAAAAPETPCLTDTADIFGDGSGIALYSLDYDASDASGNYDGIPYSVDFGVDGEINWAGDFNSTGYIDTNLTMPSTTTFGFSCWFKQTSAANAHLVGDFTTSATNPRFRVQITSSGGIDVGIGDGSNMTYSQHSAMTNYLNVWKHILVAVNGTSVIVYIDGTTHSSATHTNSLASGSNNLIIGAYAAGTSSYQNFNGLIDQVRFLTKGSYISNQVTTIHTETACVYTSTTDTNNYQDTITAYYKFDGNANDETTNYDGTEYNITYDFGRFGTAAVFNGTSSYVSLTDIPSSVSADISISAWINADTLSGDRTIVSLRENRLIEISINSGYSAGQRLEFKFNDGGNKVINLNENLITVGNWHHICLTAQAGGNMIAYFDGVAQGSPLAIGNVNVAGQGDTIGAYVSGSGGFFDGKIDQVRIYGLLLDATEVANLYNEKQAYITKNASDPFGDNSEVAFYELENNANDSTGSNDITSTNVTFTSGSGLFGTYAAGFNGSSQYITTGVDSSDISMTNTSFSCWVNFTATSGTIMDNGGAVSSGRGLVLETGSGYIVWQQANGTSGQSTSITSASNSYNDGNWHHVVGTIDGSRVMKLYIDGNVESSTPTANSSATSPLYTLEIGRRAFYNSQYFYGWIDQVRIFNRVLDGDEVFKLYAEVIN